MVEAAVVMPVIILFFGLQVYIYSAYTGKQQVMAESRNEAFSKALKGACSLLPFPIEPDRLNERGAADIANEVGMDMIKNGAVGATATKRATNAGFVSDVITSRVTAKSFVYCNTRGGAIEGQNNPLVNLIKATIKVGVNAVKGVFGGDL